MQYLEEALRDRLVCGLNNSSIQKKLLSKNDLTLQRANDIRTAAEMAVLQPSDKLTLQHETEVLAVQQECKWSNKQEENGDGTYVKYQISKIPTNVPHNTTFHCKRRPDE